MAYGRTFAVSPVAENASAPLGLRVPTWIPLGLIALATVLVYWPALGGGKLWDDNAHIPRSDLRSLAGLSRMWLDVTTTQQYYPLLFSWFWLQFQLWGEHMLGYHIVNLLLHLGTVFLAYAVLRKLKIPGALLATAIFALHPVHVETVAWITEQKNTLSAVFYLGAMLAYLHFDETRLRSWYALAFGLFVAALLSKTVTVTLPPALLVIFWWQRGTISWRRDVMPLLPFFALSAASGLLTAWVERKVLHAEGEDFDLSLAQGVLLAGRASWFYLGKLLWPVNLMFMYPRWDLDPSEWSQWLYPVALITLLVGLWAIRKTSRAPLAAALFFLGTLFPVLGFLNVFFFRYSFVSDHFPYLASLGVIALVAGAVATWLDQLGQLARTVAVAVCVIALGAMSVLARQQTAMYQDIDLFYHTIIADNPRSWMAYHNLGLVNFERGQLPEAIDCFTKSLEIRPNHAEGENNLGASLLHAGRAQEAIEHFEQAARIDPEYPSSYNNLGNALVQLGRPQEAVEYLQRALKFDPSFASAHNNLGNALLRVGRLQEAIDQYEEALRINPDHALAHCNLGAAFLRLGRPAEAAKHFEAALRIKPDSQEALDNLGIALLNLGRPQEAIDRFQQALQLKPESDDTRRNLADALLSLNRVPEAIVQLQESARRHPDDVTVQNNLGAALLNTDRADEAISPLQQAVKLQPGLADARCNLGRALSQTGRTEEALEQFEQAVELKPDFAEAWANLSEAESQLNRPEKAVSAAQKALDLARAAGQSLLAAQLEARLITLRERGSQPQPSLTHPVLPPAVP